MLSSYFIQQFEYVIWADRQCLEAARTVDPANYNRDYGFSFRTVHDTLVHMLGAQHIWLGRWKQEPVRPFPSGKDFDSLQTIEQAWSAVHTELRNFTAHQDEHSLMKRIEYQNLKGERRFGLLWELMNHCADHSNYHRGQFNSLVKLAGGVPANTMYVTWQWEREGQV